MKERTVTYLMSGPAHLPYLIVSLSTLRQHYDGPIEVYAYPESLPTVEQIAQDKRLRIQPVAWEPIPVEKKSNSQFLNKIKVLQEPTAVYRVYLDADTSIRGPIDLLFSKLEPVDAVLTQFSQWKSTGNIIRKRISRLVDIDSVFFGPPVERLCSTPYPSPNGGILAVRPGCGFLRQWFDRSWQARSVFICDECVLHVLMITCEGVAVLQGGRYNCSHKYQGDISNPVIMHYHGDSNTRPQKSPQAVAEWFDLYRKCWMQDLGSVRSWGQWATSLNKHMRKLKGHPDYGDLVESTSLETA